MGRSGGKDMRVHPRLTVVPVDTEERAETVAAMRARFRLVGHDDLTVSLQRAIEQRAELDGAVLADLEERRVELESRLAAAEQALTEVTDEQQRSRRAA